MKNLCTVADCGKKFSKPHLVKPYVLCYQNHHTNISCNKYNHHGLQSFTGNSLFNILFPPILYRLNNFITERQCT